MKTKQLSNIRIVKMCNNIINNLQRYSREYPCASNFLCCAFQEEIEKFLRKGVSQQALSLYIPEFTRENANKFNANGQNSVWWTRLSEARFNFKDRIAFVEWIKEQHLPKSN